MSTKRLLLILGILLLSASRSFAAGGTCPSGASYPGATPFTFSSTLSSLGITSCYFVSAAGSDSNNGTTESTPWAHVPGMPGCSATCASTTPAAGSGIILRGGDTWSSAQLGFTLKGTGTTSNPIYLGVDKTWFTGSSWVRPIFTCGGALCTNNAGDFLIVTSNVIVDNIEFNGLHETANSAGGSGGCGTVTPCSGTGVSPNYVLGTGSGDIGENCYFHLWSTDVTSTRASGTGGPASITYVGFNMLRYNVADGTDSYTTISGVPTGSMFFTHGTTPIAYGNYMTHLNTGLDGPGDNWHDNVVEWIVNAFGGGHFDGLYQYGPANQNVVLMYNNVVRHNEASPLCGAVKFWMSGNDANTATGYAFNNVEYDQCPANMIDTGGHFGVNYGTWYFFNNTVQCGYDTDMGGCVLGDAGNKQNGQFTGGTMALFLSNNHWIQSGTSSPLSCAQATWTCPTETPGTFQTLSTANSQGYSDTTAYAFQPTQANGSTVHTGKNESALCTAVNAQDTFAGASCLSDTTYGVAYNSTNHSISYPARTVNARNFAGTPDIGAFQFQAGASNPLLSASPTSLAFGSLTTSGACPGVGCASLSTTITNVGTANATSISAAISPTNTDYTITVSPASSLTPNSNTTVTVQCAPTISGAEAATNLSITSNAPTVTVPLTCTGTTTAAITPAPSTLAFGNQLQSTTSSTLTDTVTSSGGANFVFNASPYTLGGTNPGDFSIVTPGAITWTTVQKANNFTCASGTVSPATFTCTASFTSNITAGHTLVALASLWNIKTAGSTISVPTHNATTGDSDTWTHCTSGAGTNIFSTSNTYSVTDCDYVLSATGGSKSVTISWTPHGYTTGIIQEDLEIYELSASAGTVAVDTQGSQTNTNCTTCTGPALTLTGASDAVFQWSSNPDNTFTSISGGSYTCDNDNTQANVYGAFCLGLNQGSAPAQTWTYGGASPVAMSAVAFTSNASMGNACVGNLTVMPNGTCTIQATFTPTTTGSRTATLTLNGNASGSISLTGTGTSSTPVSTPTLSPVPATYTSTQTVTITSATSGATICYTMDGSTPAASTPGTCSNGSTLTNGGTVSVSVTESLLALGTKAALTNSGVAGGLYTITTTPTLAAPSFSVPGGSALSFSPITINLPSGSTGCYTIDGTTPAASSPGTCSHGTTYSTPITITQNTQLQALATEAANNNSTVTSAQYNVILPTPTFTPNTQFGPNGQIIMISVQSGATICVTTNGATPASNGSGSGTCSVGQALSNGATITITQPTVIQAIGTQSNYVDSGIGTAVIVSPASAPAVILML